MKLQIHGSKSTGFSAHGESDIEVLANCPFCGSDVIEVSNTHTPSYSGHCLDCGCEGPSNAYPKRNVKPERLIRKQHERAFAQAVDLWNKRVT